MTAERRTVQVAGTAARRTGFPAGMRCCSLAFLLTAALGWAPAAAETTSEQVDALVKVHHLDGIPYGEAHQLGPEALPHLLELLNEPSQREFWVNAIVTLGFIEDAVALAPLASLLSRAAGEVDGHTFRALLSIPYAVGCLASTGNQDAYAFLLRWLKAPTADRPAWSYRGNDLQRLLIEQAVIGLAASGRADARAELLALRDSIEAQGAGSDRRYLLDTIDSALQFHDRIVSLGRESALSPR